MNAHYGSHSPLGDDYYFNFTCMDCKANSQKNEAGGENEEYVFTRLSPTAF